MKESKIKEIISKREFKGDKRSSWYFTVEMENRDKGQLCKSDPDAVKVGDVVKYTIEEKGGYIHFRTRENNFRRGAFSAPTSSSASVALGFAKDIAVSNIKVNGKPLEMTDELAQKITAMAGSFHKWLMEKESGQTK